MFFQYLLEWSWRKRTIFMLCWVFFESVLQGHLGQQPATTNTLKNNKNLTFLDDSNTGTQEFDSDKQFMAVWLNNKFPAKGLTETKLPSCEPFRIWDPKQQKNKSNRSSLFLDFCFNPTIFVFGTILSTMWNYFWIWMKGSWYNLDWKLWVLENNCTL